jgi:hypothetical protein
LLDTNRYCKSLLRTAATPEPTAHVVCRVANGNILPKHLRHAAEALRG